MRIDIVTILPDFFAAPLGAGVVGRAVNDGRVHVGCVNPRDFTADRHRTVDDSPYGGGAGMVLKAPPLVDAIESVTGPGNPGQVPVVLLSPQGERFTQPLAYEMASWPHWVLVCGRYKGIDERVRQLVVTREVSIGDYVLSGGEPAALVVLDAVVRLLPGVLGDEDSAATDSFGPQGGRGLDCTYWTRPAEFRGLRVPEVLLSGHHARIADWRQQEAAARTRQRRPDLAAPESGSEASTGHATRRASRANDSSWRRTG